MVQLLRIITVAVSIFAGLVLASVRWPVPRLHLGAWQDPKAEEFLASKSAVERFNERRSDEAPDNQDKTPPLVRQAKALAEILNPRSDTAAAPTTTPKINEQRSQIIPPRSTAKFEVFGISYSPSDPKSSFAYIRLPDNTFLWVQQGSEVGHQIVKEVNRNSITCMNGQQIIEMPLESPLDTSSMLESGTASSAAAGSGRPEPVPAGGSNLRAELASRAISAVSPSTLSRLSAKDEEGMNELMRKIKERQKGYKPDGDDSNTISADANTIGQMISDFKSSRVSPEEAAKLEDLGKQLNGTKDDAAAAKRRELMRRLNLPRSSKQ